ncbi:MAG: HAD-IG family 5'-nucleotidase [Silvanigrellales bacterium]|jgi:HAD superfamily 5'-nucleotidase-like hydrolase|nr:HAD-IG family 5'-nucleotidase [Silvanigrellales bacterium]
MAFNVGDVEPRYRVYCNRSLNMKAIKAVGFDMDYTLALYKPEAFETLAYAETLKKLVQLGYPEEILGWTFDWNYMVRGLLIDKHRGNVLKMDRHRYVKLAFHGFKQLSRDERNRLYHSDAILSYEEPDFALIDTLFTLADAYLFSQLVELKAARPGSIAKSEAEVYKDVRAAIDLCHRDGSIKLRVAEDPGRYIHRDPHFVECLQRLKDSGRKLFIATNSLWDYTQVVMNFLFGNETGVLNDDWTSMFDLIITGASKPSFFISQNALYAVDTATGMLRNVDLGFGSHKVFQGGNFRQLHQFLGIENGTQVLYVGDHIYGDILRSKKDLGWRTMLVISELEGEIDNLRRNADEHRRYEELLHVKDALDDEIQRLATLLQQAKEKGAKSADAQALAKQLDRVTTQRANTREALRKNLREYHSKFHPVWGEIMKSGHQNSRFAAQVENYACLYTSKFTNLRFYSPNKSYRSTRDYMPHDEVAT